ECKRMKIPVLPPDINESFGDFTVINTDSKKGIRFGLYTIKNLGVEIADAVIQERKTNGAFKSFSDFLDRIQHKNLNKKSLEALIKSGAMDAFGERNQLLFNIDEALNYNRESIKLKQSQTSLFSLMQDSSTIPELKLKKTESAGPHEKLSWEKELLGLYVSGHPLDKFKDKMEKIKTKIGAAKKLEDNMPVVIAGVVEEARRVVTKRNEAMLFAKISDYTDTIEAVIFPRVLEKYGEIIREGNCVALKGRISLRNNEPSIIVEEMKEMKN
ncbi:MAG: OB-fold nucleic acid binding domain-containing protein, partial [Candidatus Parcubacteria bacterium]|nr:OB-fold nucleic acid binding domain-containing protein [Candidatus Parcubacteria bacterium]